jgi:hypothetical protein
VKVEEQYFDVLQNIETAILSVYEIDARLLDLDVSDALDVLIRNYALEEQGVGTRTSRLSGPAQRVHDLARGICEWRLGRQPLNTANPPAGRWASGELSLVELVVCLKRIRKSVWLWNDQGGRQGYLDYIRQFLEDARRQAGA